MQKNQTILITVKKIGINGEGIGYYKKMPVFIDEALPGEEVIAEITHVKSTYAYAKRVRNKTESPHRVKPFCPIFHQCGGCQLQHLSVAKQHATKLDLVKESLQKYTSVQLRNVKFIPVEPGFSDRYYRHKAQMPLVNTKEGVQTALYQKDSKTPVVMRTCPVHHPEINRVNGAIIDLLKTIDLRAFDERSRDGLLRTLVTRVSSATGDIQVTFIVTIYNFLLKDLAKACLEIPGVKGVSISKNYEAHTHEVWGETTELLAGESTLKEQLGPLTFNLSPKAFFQLNPPVAKRIYEDVLTHVKGSKTAVDLYTGSGPLALMLGTELEKVTGIDINEFSIQNAKENAKINDLNHVIFMKDQASHGLKYLLKKGIPDVITCDPPRSGLDESTLKAMNESGVKKIIYVSCNPASLAKNLNELKNYQLTELKAYDMFPHTSHVESLAVLNLIHVS
jgi:23S rRNA (uracil-5-)-methyltransferase RumA